MPPEPEERVHVDGSAGTDGARRVGTPAAALVVVASMVGTGVFTTTGLLLRDLGSPLAVLAAWAVGGLLAVSGALSYAELAAALPRNGGEYQLLGRIYHPVVGFAAGIVSLVVGFSAPLAASALAFGHYLAAVVPGVAPAAAAVGIVALAATLHGIHVRFGVRVQAAATLLELALVLAFVVAASGGADPALLAAPDLPAARAGPFAAALVYVSFAYSGWNGAVYLAGEVRSPSRGLPLALVAGTMIVAALYLALNVVFLSSAPAGELAGVVDVAHVAATRLLGPGAGRLVSALIALCLASSVSAMLMAGPRVYQAMGVDHPALAVLARRTRHGGPVVAMAFQAALAVVLIATASFGALLAYVGFTLSIVAGLAVVGVIVLRWREPALPRPYRTWGYPVTPLLFGGLSSWMVAHALREKPAASWAGVATLLLAAGLYALVGRRRRGDTAREAP
jgi:APA family basic amino acid/polyamine antiporter